MILHSADPAGSATTGQLVVQFVLALGAGGLLTAIANAFFSRKRSSADTKKTEVDTEGSAMDAAAVLTGANLTLLKRMDEDLAKMAKRQEVLEAEVTTLSQQVTESQERERGHVRQLTAYRTWIELASQALSGAGIPIEPPPHDLLASPMLPPAARPARPGRQ